MGIGPLLAGIVPVFAVIMVGYGVRRKLITDESHWVGMDRLTYYILIPALLIVTLGGADFAAIPVEDLVTTLLITTTVIMVLLAALHFVMFRKKPGSAPAFTSVFQCATRWNGFMALAIVVNLYSPDAQAIVALAMVALVPVINTINISLMTWMLTEEDVSLFHVFKKVLTNPIIVGCAIGIAIAFLDIPVWVPVWQTMEILGQATLALLLITVGAGLHFSRLTQGLSNILVSSSLKLLITPLATLVVALTLGLEGETLAAAIIVASMPTAINGYVMARQMGGDAPLYANTVSFQVLASFVTIPFWIEVAKYAAP